MTNFSKHTIDELCEFTNGFAFKSGDYIEKSDETIEVFRMGYIERGGGFKEDSTPVFIPQNYGRDLSKYLLLKDDILIAMTDMKNNVAILANTARIKDDKRFVLNQRVGCLRVKNKDFLDPTYLYFYTNWKPHIEYLRSRANSGVQVNLSTSAIKDAELCIPPLSEQKAIASVLGALDDKIENNRQMNETLEEMARAIFKSWFVDFDPVHAKAAGNAPAHMDADIAALFPSSFGDDGLPVGWAGKKIENVMEFAYGKALKASDRIEGEVPVYGSGGITGSHNVPLVEGPSVIIGRKGTIGSLYWEDRPFFPIDTTFYLKPKNDLAFCFYLLQTLKLDNMNTDAAVPGLNRNNVYRLEFTMPSDNCLMAFGEFVGLLREKIRSNREETQTLATLRDTLLPKLMSGEIRVTDAKRQVKTTA